MSSESVDTFSDRGACRRGQAWFPIQQMLGVYDLGEQGDIGSPYPAAEREIAVYPYRRSTGERLAG